MSAQPVNIYRQVPSYRQVADDVARRISSGEITRRLPSELALAEEYEVSCGTVRHAMSVLRQRGLIVTIHGRGTFVATSMPLTSRGVGPGGRPPGTPALIGSNQP